jgi:hypothetical protein
MVKSALEAGLSLGRALSGVKGPLKPLRERALCSIFKSGNTLHLQFPREDLGFSYDIPGGAILTDSAAEAVAAHLRSTAKAAAELQRAELGSSRCIVSTPNGQGRGRQYVPTTAPGTRLPHADICVVRGPGAGSEEVLSTLDLLPYRSIAVLLVVSGAPGAMTWAKAALQLAAQGVPIHVAHICSSHQQALQMADAYADSTTDATICVAVDVSQHWQELRMVRHNAF